MNTREIDEKTISDNILIAEFWGYKFYPADKWYKFNGYIDHYWIENSDKSIQRLNSKNFRFHWDWNWLIPVIKKINNIKFLDAPHNHELIVYQTEFIVKVRNKIIENDFDGAYELVVNFINEYNKK